MAFFPGVSMPAYFQSIATARKSGQQVFHDFLEPALLSGWPVFQLIHFFTSIVRLNDGFEEPQLLTIYLSEPDRCRIGS